MVRSLYSLLRYDGYTVVGLTWSPIYLNYERGTSSIGSGSVGGFVLIPEEGFDSEVSYEIYLTMDNPPPAYSAAYDSWLDGFRPAVEALLEERAELRFEDLYSEAMGEIQDAELEIADGWREYFDQRGDAQALVGRLRHPPRLQAGQVDAIGEGVGLEDRLPAVPCLGEEVGVHRPPGRRHPLQFRELRHVLPGEAQGGEQAEVIEPLRS